MAKYVKTEDGYKEIEVINYDKMNSDNPVGTGSFSMGRSPGTVIGAYSHAEGLNTTASGNDSHAEGLNTTASGADSHAEGSATTASGGSSHAEGGGTKASGVSSHAEGKNTTASGNFSHAEGGGTTASGSSSHAEGSATTASGGSSHAEGNNTRAASINQHVQGKFNIVDDKGTYAHIVGNGSGTSSRSNTHTLDWSGNAWFAGDVYTGSTSGTNKDDGSKKLATEEYVDNKVSDFGGIQSPTNAKVGQTIVVKAVDENGKPTEWEVEDKPDKLPNPNALTFTGAVSGTYDGSAPLSVNIPQGGGGTGGETFTGQFEELVNHTVTADEATAVKLTFTQANYPKINGHKTLLVEIIKPSSVSTPWFGINAGNTEVINGGTSNWGYYRAAATVHNGHWLQRSATGTNVFNQDVIAPGYVFNSQTLGNRNKAYANYTSLTISSYTKFLEEGTTIKIYGGK